MAELHKYLDWEEAMSLCEKSVTNAVRNFTYGLINDRYAINDRLNYTVTFCSKPKSSVKCDVKNKKVKIGNSSNKRRKEIKRKVKRKVCRLSI